MEMAMRKKIRRIFTILGTTALIFTLTACGNRMDTMQPAASYVADFFDIPDTVTGIERLLIKDDMAYMCCLEEDGTSYLAAMDIGDGRFLRQNLNVDSSVSLLDFGFAPDNSIWTVCLEEAGGYSLRKFDNSGSPVQSVDLAGVMDTSVLSAAGRDLFLSIDGEGNICVAVKGGNTLVYLFGNNGRFLFSLDYEGNLMTTTTTAGGQIGICATSSDRMNHDLLTVDMESQDWSKDKIHLGAAAGLYGGVNKDFYRFDSSVLYGYAAGGQEGIPVFNWSDMGLGTSEVHIGECTDGRFVVLAASSNQTGVLSYEMAVLTEGVDEREILSMVSLTATPGLVQAVSDFNKTNDRYKVELTEYFPYAQDVSNEEWDNAILNLNTRIISGDMPDILDMSNLPVQIYQSKGLLEDLYPYMEHDPEIRTEDYFENIFDAISLDGKLPYLTDGVAISTMLTGADIVDGNNGWTIQDLEKVLDTYGANSINNLSGASFLKVMLQTDGSFIDWSLGKCSFDSLEFVKMLEFAGKIQESRQNGFEGMEMSDTYAAAYEAVLSVYHITQYRNYYNGNLKFIGLPGGGGEYHVIKPEVKVGISSSSPRKERAWEFVRTLLTEEHQMSCISIPIHQRAFDKVMQAAVDGKSVWTWIYEDGKATKEDVELTKQLLSSAAYVENDNQTLESLILEEAREYFSGVRSALEAAERIQSRASLYIKEQM